MQPARLLRYCLGHLFSSNLGFDYRASYVIIGFPAFTGIVGTSRANLILFDNNLTQVGIFAADVNLLLSAENHLH